VLGEPLVAIQFCFRGFSRNYKAKPGQRGVQLSITGFGVFLDPYVKFVYK
jgi:hypothetical protein